MTQRRRNREKKLFKPRSQKPWRDDPYDPCHRTALDTGPEDLTAPSKTPERNHPLRAACFEQARALVDAALAWAGAGHAPMLTIPDQCGREVEATMIFQEAGLSRQEARAWELYSAGFSYLTIREFMDRTRGSEPLSIRTVETFIYRGGIKLRRYTECGSKGVAC